MRTLFRYRWQVLFIFTSAIALHLLLDYTSFLSDADGERWDLRYGMGYGEGFGEIVNWRGHLDRLGFKLGDRTGKGRRVKGSLSELVRSSIPSLYDRMSTADKLRLSTSRFLPYSLTSASFSRDQNPSSSTKASGKDKQLGRKHILVTGGFGSVGRKVVKDLLLRDPLVADEDDFLDSSTEGRQENNDVIVTILDVSDRSKELDWLLRHRPPSFVTSGGTGRQKIDVVDPRSAAFSAQEASLENLIKRGRLRIMIGDVRNQTVLQEAFFPSESSIRSVGGHASGVGERPHRHSIDDAYVDPLPPISGIVHLARYGSDACVKVNREDCEDVAGKGMAEVLKFVERVEGEGQADGKEKKAVPWILVVGEKDEDRVHYKSKFVHTHNITISQIPLTLQTPLQIATSLLSSFASSTAIHSIALRIPPATHRFGDVYGSRYDPIPNLIHKALGHLPIRTERLERIWNRDADGFAGFLSLDDISKMVVDAADLLELSNEVEFLRSRAIVTEIDVVPPSTGGSRADEGVDSVKGLVERVRTLTRSDSAISTSKGTLSYGAILSAFETAGRTRQRTTSILGSTPSTPLLSSLKTYIHSLLSLQLTYVSRKAAEKCVPPPSEGVLEEGLLDLDGCDLVQLLTVVDGVYWTLGCSHGMKGEDGGGTVEKPLAMLRAVPYKEGVRGVKLKAEIRSFRTFQGVEEKVMIGFSCPSPDDPQKYEEVGWVDGSSDTDEGPLGIPKPGIFALEGDVESDAGDDAEVLDKAFQVDFTNEESRTFTLTLRSKSISEPIRRLAWYKAAGGKESRPAFLPLFEQIDGKKTMHFKISPVCCKGRKESGRGWNFLEEDPLLTSQVYYPSPDGTTTLTESTLAIQQCSDLRSASDYTSKLLSWLKNPSSSLTCPRRTMEGGGDWIAKDLIVCTIDCAAPLRHLISDRCKATHDMCGDSNSMGPFPGLAFTGGLSFGPNMTSERFVSDAVEKVPWAHVLLPDARIAFEAGESDFPKVSVVSLGKATDTHRNEQACYELQKASHPFSGDHILIEALRNQSIRISEADFVMLPFYQGCYRDYTREHTYKKLAETVAASESQIVFADQSWSGKVVVPFMHDWGSCTGWWPRLEDVLSRTPPPPMGKAISLQVNGDFNTRCVKSRDIIIPPRTKNTPALNNFFGSQNNLVPTLRRPYLGFFAGSMMGFGSLTRTRIGCFGPRGAAEGKVVYQNLPPGEEYLGMLSKTKFCLLPRGVPGWTTRTVESIFAGCIPVFIADRTLQPFSDILDYSTFSLSAPENRVDQIEQILESIAPERMQAMQHSLIKVREAFLLSEDEPYPGKGESDRMGPLFWTLLSMKLRLNLGYPLSGVVASC